MLTVPIYSSERKAGLADALSNGITVSAYCQLLPNADRKESLCKAVASAVKKDIDLYWLDSILVSTGWNKNSEVFLPEEVWPARHTAKNKPFNYSHNSKDILGHMTDSYAVDLEYKAIADDLNIDELPKKFHILTSAVIYKFFEDEKQIERIQKLITEIENGKWFVSMECLATNFDYALISSTGEQKIVVRNTETAQLTQYLRQYGGPGKYKDFILGRVLRNITFSGEGLVEAPANPESVILNTVADFNGELVSAVYIDFSSDLQITNQESVMTELEVKELEAKLVKAEKNLLDTEAASKLVVAELAELTKKFVALETELAAKDTKVKELEVAVNTFATEKKVSVRKAALVEAKVPGEKVEELGMQLAVLDDSLFATVLSTLKAAYNQPVKTVVETSKPEEKVLEEAETVPVVASLNTTVSADSQVKSLSEHISKNVFKNKDK